jgi:hypothetical protein
MTIILPQHGILCNLKRQDSESRGDQLCLASSFYVLMIAILTQGKYEKLNEWIWMPS